MPEQPAASTRAEPSPEKKRDWFGYIFTTVGGLVATVLVAWYQLYATQRDAAAAELEKARAVREAATAIVEEHVLNGKKLEFERLARLIDQRRREEGIRLAIPVVEVVELAEFAISSSRHLSVERKEEIKPVFDAFYADQRSRAFQPSDGDSPSAALLNEVARRIQEGKPGEALETLRLLDQAHTRELSEAAKTTRPSVAEALLDIFSSPTKAGMFLGFMVLYFWALFAMLRAMRRHQRRRSLGASF